MTKTQFLAEYFALFTVYFNKFGYVKNVMLCYVAEYFALLFVALYTQGTVNSVYFKYRAEI